MKKVLFAAVAALAITAGHASGDPTAPYHDYGPAMESTKEQPLTSVWQSEERAAIDAAVSDVALAAIAADATCACALLAKVQGAYTTDPLTLTQIAALSQWVMKRDSWLDQLCFWSPTHADGRKVWVKALVETAESSSDVYVKMLCLDQLRWCGCDCPCLVARVRALGDKCGDKSLREMADLVVRSVSAKK